MQSLVSLIQKLPPPFDVFAERFDQSSIEHFHRLEKFIQTRTSYISQTALYGYLKTRMGTSFRKVFEDQYFAGEIHAATVKLYGSCLCDLVIHCVAKIAPYTNRAKQMALHLYDCGIAQGLSKESQQLIEANLRERFVQRLDTLDWQQAKVSMNAFCWSKADIVRYAPVIEEYKQLDSEIVSNSIHFRWVDIVRQTEKRLAAKALAANWQTYLAATPQSEQN